MLLAGFDCTCLNLCTILTTFSIKLFLSAVYYHMNILNSSKHSPILIIEKSEIKCISIAVMVVAIRIQEGGCVIVAANEVSVGRESRLC